MHFKMKTTLPFYKTMAIADNKMIVAPIEPEDFEGDRNYFYSKSDRRVITHMRILKWINCEIVWFSAESAIYRRLKRKKVKYI